MNQILIVVVAILCLSSGAFANSPYCKGLGYEDTEVIMSEGLVEGCFAPGFDFHLVKGDTQHMDINCDKVLVSGSPTISQSITYKILGNFECFEISYYSNIDAVDFPIDPTANLKVLVKDSRSELFETIDATYKEVSRSGKWAKYSITGTVPKGPGRSQAKLYLQLGFVSRGAPNDNPQVCSIVTAKK